MRLFNALFVLGLIGGLLSSCQTIPEPTRQDEVRVRQLLLGTWHTSFEHGGSKLNVEKTFFKDGTAKGKMEGRISGSGTSILMPPIPFTSRWKLEGGRITIYEMVSQDSDILDPTDVDEDVILEISTERILYWSGGETFSYRRGPIL